MSDSLDLVMDDCTWYQSVGEATSVPPARWPLDVNTTNLDFGMRACVVYPNWFMSSCCEPGVGKRSADGTTTDHCGWDVCLSTLSDAQLTKCFKRMASDGGSDNHQNGDWSGEHGQDHQENNGEGSQGGEWTGDDGSWKPNGKGEGGYDDGMWHGKRSTTRAHRVRSDAFEFSCAKPSAAAPMFVLRAALGSALFATAVAILAVGL